MDRIRRGNINSRLPCGVPRQSGRLEVGWRRLLYHRGYIFLDGWYIQWRFVSAGLIFEIRLRWPCYNCQVCHSNVNISPA